MHADVDAMVDEALDASRSGNIVSRVARDLTGGEEDAQVPPQVRYSQAAVAGLVEHVVAKVDRPAQDAKVDFPSLEQVRTHPGFKVQRGRARAARASRRSAFRAWTAGSRRRSTRIKPKVTRAELAQASTR